MPNAYIKTTVRVEGLSRAVSALRKAGADSQDMKRLMHDIGMIVVRAAQPPVLTGRLRQSMRAGNGKTKAVVRAGGARVPYAPIIHYGDSHRNIEAQPFLTQALQRTRGQQFNKLDDGIGDILRKNNLT